MFMDIESWNILLQDLIQKEKPQARWTLKYNENIQPDCLPPGWKQYQQKAFGRFRCSSCRRSWASAQVNVLCQMYQKMGKGHVLMRCFGQKCKNCSLPQFEKPDFSPETTKRILHNLVQRILEKFYGEGSRRNSEMPVNIEAPLKGFHDKDNCEACSLGICMQNLDENIMSESDFNPFSYMEMGSYNSEGLGTSYATTVTQMPSESHAYNSYIGQYCPSGVYQQATWVVRQQSVLVASYLPLESANSTQPQIDQERQEMYSLRRCFSDNSLRSSSNDSPLQDWLSKLGYICAVALFTYLAAKYAYKKNDQSRIVFSSGLIPQPRDWHLRYWQLL